jgi:hypothetical protein
VVPTALTSATRFSSVTTSPILDVRPSPVDPQGVAGVLNVTS